jgi:hypothetical protein
MKLKRSLNSNNVTRKTLRRINCQFSRIFSWNFQLLWSASSDDQTFLIKLYFSNNTNLICFDLLQKNVYFHFWPVSAIKNTKNIDYLGTWILWKKSHKNDGQFLFSSLTDVRFMCLFEWCRYSGATQHPRVLVARFSHAYRNHS